MKFTHHLILLFGLVCSSQFGLSFNLPQHTPDTQHQFVTDSFFHRLDTVDISQTRQEITLQYIGSDTLIITRTFTGDPHFICSYPREPIVPLSTFTIKICYSHRGRVGRFHKVMGFTLSNGNKIYFRFTGYVRPH